MVNGNNENVEEVETEDNSVDVDDVIEEMKGFAEFDTPGSDIYNFDSDDEDPKEDSDDDDENDGKLIGEDIEIDESIYLEGYISDTEIAKRKKLGKFLWLIILAVAFLTAFVIKTVFITTAFVPSESMEPTIYKGDIIIGKSDVLIDRHIKRGDIIIFRAPKHPYKRYVKRVIGVPGDKVVIVRNKIYINGELFPIEEPYVKEGTWDDTNIKDNNIHTYNIPKGSYFALGDNRTNSEDSRYWGYIPNSYIYGVADHVIHSIFPFKIEKLQ